VRSVVLTLSVAAVSLGGFTAVGAIASAPTATAATPLPQPATQFHQPCPAPQSLVTGGHWRAHRLAPGVTLREKSARDRTVGGAPGVVSMHVLTVDTTRHTVRTAPLFTHIAQRQPLSQLADGHEHLVAATNTGFFDFYRGAPLGPVFDADRPLSIGSTGAPIVGLTRAGRIHAAHAHLVGTVSAAGHRSPLVSQNYLTPARGLSLYTQQWGFAPVPLPAGRTSVIRQIKQGRLDGAAMHGNHAPSTRGDLLVASTPETESWLRGLPSGTPITVRSRVATSTKAHLVEGYDVGLRLVRPGGTPQPGLACQERDSQAARTAVGIADGGRKLLILVVADHPNMRYTPGHRVMHGLDHRQMARVMIDLGASQAWEWDGSGSSEMIARLPHSDRLEIRNYCADGAERPMPIGFGVFSTAAHH
jgi:hypothetical protein